MDKVIAAGENPETVKIMLHDAIIFIEKFCDTIPSRELIQPALELACELNISIYDALFVAAAVEHRASLFTADKALSTVAKEACRVKLLE